MTSTTILARLFRRCPHNRVRCVHGDEIIARGFRRVVCLDCGRALDWDLPKICNTTGKPHPSRKRIARAEKETP